MSPISSSIKKAYAGLGSPGTWVIKQDLPVASGASTVTFPFGQASDAYTTFSGSGPVRQGKVRVKTEAPVASFLIVAIVGKTQTGAQVVLYHGDVATAIAGVSSAVVDEFQDFVSDAALTEIDVMINAGAAVNASFEVVGGS